MVVTSDFSKEECRGLELVLSTKLIVDLVPVEHMDRGQFRRPMIVVIQEWSRYIQLFCLGRFAIGMDPPNWVTWTVPASTL